MRKLTLLLLAGLLFVGCGGDTDSSSDSAATTSAPVASGPSEITAFLTKVDATEGELTYDEVDFLTGEAANAAYRQANPGETENVPNDYYIANPAKVTKTVAIAPNAQVTLNILAVNDSGSQNQGASVLELADAFVKGKTTPDGRDRSEVVATRPFKLTFSTDRAAVIKIDEIYTP